MKAIKRIKEYIDFKGVSNSAFERENDLSNGYIATQLKRNADLGEGIINKILDNCLDINPLWLLTGKGNMILDDIDVSIPTQENANNLIPLYDSIATASRIEADMQPISEPVEYINAGDWFRDATAAIRIHGDSMNPLYHSGSIAALKEVYDKSLIMFGEDYVIETEEYRAIKRIQRGNTKDELLLCSYNTERWEDGSEKGRLIHEPFPVKIDEIRRIFIVLGSVRRNHSSRIVYNRHNSL